MRSPVYGANPGDINLRGKKSRMMSCRCCWALDLRDAMNDNIARREINEAITDKERRQELKDDLHIELYGQYTWMGRYDDDIYEEYWQQYKNAA